MRHFGGQCQHMLFSEARILGDAAYTRKPIDHQHGERGIRRRVWRACKGSINIKLVWHGLSLIFNSHNRAFRLAQWFYVTAVPCLWTPVWIRNWRPACGLGFSVPTRFHRFSLFGVFLSHLKLKFLYHVVCTGIFRPTSYSARHYL